MDPIQEPIDGQHSHRPDRDAGDFCNDKDLDMQEPEPWNTFHDNMVNAWNHSGTLQAAGVGVAKALWPKGMPAGWPDYAV